MQAPQLSVAMLFGISAISYLFADQPIQTEHWRAKGLWDLTVLTALLGWGGFWK